MITLRVVSFNNQPMAAAPSCNFDELGGTIGRADSNQLVLPDPERTISRVAAQVLYRNGSFAIVDRGSNPIAINGQTLGTGRETPLKVGDRVRIGGYELQVSAGAAASASAAPDDPFAGLLGPSAAAPAPGGAMFDPLAALSAPAPARPAPAAGVPPASTPRAAAPAEPAGGIPTDWDPFAPDPTMSRPRPSPLGPGAQRLGLDIGAAAPAPLVPDLGVRSAEPSSLDALFGLGPSSGGDPLANSALDAPAANPNMATDADPLRALSMAPKAVAQALPDQVSDLNRPFIPQTVIRPVEAPAPAPAPTPAPTPVPARPVAAPPAATPPATERPAAGAAVMSWDAEGNTSHTVIRTPLSRSPEPAAVPATEPGVRPLPVPRVAAPVAAPVAPVAPVAPPAAVVPPPTPVAAPSPAPVMAAAPAAMPGAAASADVQGLLEAFRRGLQTPNLNLNTLTPELMELLGTLLHESAAGTVDLLTARATFKRELRAKGTTIVARNNNPLKFSPSAEVAVQHLLSPPARGFMAAAPAMRDAYDDLRAHQVGFVAGLQAALDGVLARFDPAELEKRLTERSMLHSLLPATRKAKMWEVFIEQYTRIRAEASDDFHTLFGTAFLKAYEDQIALLQEERER